MDMKAKITEIVELIGKNKDLLSRFNSDPAGTIKSLTGLNIPEEQLQAVIEGVKAKLSLDKGANLLGKLGKFMK